MPVRIVAFLVLLTLLAAGGWKTYYEGRKEGRAQVQAQWDKARADAIDEARAVEREMQAKLDKIRKEKTDEARRLHSDYQSLLARVRERPAANACAGLPAPAASGPAACTGAELSAGSAEDIVRLSQRADEIRLFAAQCWSAYRAASGQ